MVHLKKASQELFSRSPDERFESLDTLTEHCQRQKNESRDRWHLPRVLIPEVADAELKLVLENDGSFGFNQWSFSQLCSLSGVNCGTINRLSVDTARQAFKETLPSGDKPLQLLTSENRIRSIHGVAYSRLWNYDLIRSVREAASGFEPPPAGFNGATGLYSGQQDLFCFLIDPAGWVEIGTENFAPGFFVWNSEVGKRSVGIQTFWFQAVCQNHIVWDAVEVIDFSRKHTGKIEGSLVEIKRRIEDLAAKRDERKDAFSERIEKAMWEKVSENAEDATKLLLKNGIPRSHVTKAVKLIADEGKPFTIWAMVDALTRLSGELSYAGARTEADQKTSKLLSLAV